MTKYNVVLELDNKQFTNIIAGLNKLIDGAKDVAMEFPTVGMDPVLSRHIHETTELIEYIRERYISAERVPLEVMPDENNPAG